MRINELQLKNYRQSASLGVVIFFSMIRSYFCLFVAAFNPCQGRDPLKKYKRTYASDSKSSRRDCSIIIPILKIKGNEIKNDESISKSHTHA